MTFLKSFITLLLCFSFIIPSGFALNNDGPSKCLDQTCCSGFTGYVWEHNSCTQGLAAANIYSGFNQCASMEDPNARSTCFENLANPGTSASVDNLSTTKGKAGALNVTRSILNLALLSYGLSWDLAKSKLFPKLFKKARAKLQQCKAPSYTLLVNAAALIALGDILNLKRLRKQAEKLSQQVQSGEAITVGLKSGDRTNASPSTDLAQPGVAASTTQVDIGNQVRAFDSLAAEQGVIGNYMKIKSGYYGLGLSLQAIAAILAISEAVEEKVTPGKFTCFAKNETTDNSQTQNNTKPDSELSPAQNAGPNLWDSPSNTDIQAPAGGGGSGFGNQAPYFSFNSTKEIFFQSILKNTFTITDAYFAFNEWQRWKDGENKSVSLDHYQQMKKQNILEKVGVNLNELKAALLLTTQFSAEKISSLMISEAQADDTNVCKERTNYGRSPHITSDCDPKNKDFKNAGITKIPICDAYIPANGSAPKKAPTQTGEEFPPMENLPWEKQDLLCQHVVDRKVTPGEQWFRIIAPGVTVASMLTARLSATPETRIILALTSAGLSSFMTATSVTAAKQAASRYNIIIGNRNLFTGNPNISQCSVQNRSDPTKPSCYCYNDDNTMNGYRSNSEICMSEWGLNNYALGSDEYNPYANQGKGCVDMQSGFDQMCECRKIGTCATTDWNTQFGGSFGGMNWQDLFKNANSLMNGNTSFAGLDGMGLGNRAARTLKQVKTMQNKINQDRAKEGKAPVNFDGQSSNILAKMASQIPAGAGGSAASLTTGAGRLGSESTGKEKDLLDKIAKDAGIDLKFTGLTAALSKKGDVDPFAELSSTGSGGGILDVGDVMKNEYDYNNNDINTKTTTPIWDTLSHRYQQSGMRRLFENP